MPKTKKQIISECAQAGIDAWNTTGGLQSLAYEELSGPIKDGWRRTTEAILAHFSKQTQGAESLEFTDVRILVQALFRRYDQVFLLVAPLSTDRPRAFRHFVHSNDELQLLGMVKFDLDSWSISLRDKLYQEVESTLPRDQDITEDHDPNQIPGVTDDRDSKDEDEKAPPGLMYCPLCSHSRDCHSEEGCHAEGCTCTKRKSRI